MKLVFFISSMKCGGAERVMSVLTDELVNRGHDVTLVIMSTYPIFYQLNKNVKIIQFENRVNNSIYGKIKYKLRRFYFVRKSITNLNPDIVISFMYGTNAIVLMSSIFLRVPIIASEHTTFDEKHSFIKKIQRFHINKIANKVTVLTEYDYNYIGERLNNKTIMPNPLSFIPISEYNNDREKYIIAAGSINRFRGKGFDSLVKIWGEIAKQYPSWKLVIAGDGSEEKKTILYELARGSNLSDQFVLLGQVSDLDKKLRECSIFVLSSLNEGLPMVLLEAMSQGCACVSFDCKTGPREIIDNDVNGILVEDQNMEAMKEALSELIDNNDKRESLAKQAIKSVDRFSVKNIVDKWELLFNEVINS